MISQQRSEDDFGFSRAVGLLTRLRHHQGELALTRAMKESSKLNMRFCTICGQETAHERNLCIQCGAVATPEADVGEVHSD